MEKEPLETKDEEKVEEHNGTKVEVFGVPEEKKQLTPEQLRKKKNRRKNISNLIFLAAMTALVLTLFLSFGELETIGDTIKQIGNSNNWVYLLIAFVLAAVYFVLWPLTLHLFAKASSFKSTFADDFMIGSSEHFYNGITPFATGGQPFQIYSYTKCNATTAQGTGVILANFTTYMLVTNVFALISLFFWNDFTANLSAAGEYFNSDLSWFKWVAVAGFIINFLVLLFMIALGTSKTIRKGIYGIFHLLCKIKFIGKHLQKRLPMLDEYCNNAQTSFKEIFTHWKTFIACFFIKAITMAIYYIIPFFLMKSMGLEVGYDQLYLVLFGTAFAITAVVFVPTPGGTGGIDYAFAIVIASTVSSGLAQTQAVSLLWRLLTYYFLMLVSFIFSALLEARITKRLKKEERLLEAKDDSQAL